MPLRFSVQGRGSVEIVLERAVDVDVVDQVQCMHSRLLDTADSESLVRGAPRARKIHLIQKNREMHGRGFESSRPLPFERGVTSNVHQHIYIKLGTR